MGPSRRRASGWLVLLLAGVAGCDAAVPDDDRAHRVEGPSVGRVAIGLGVYHLFAVREPGVGPTRATAPPDEEELSLLSPGFVVPAGGHVHVRRDRATVYEITYDRAPTEVLEDLHAHLATRGWTSTRAKGLEELLFDHLAARGWSSPRAKSVSPRELRLQRGKTVIVVRLRSDDRGRIVISALRG